MKLTKEEREWRASVSKLEEVILAPSEFEALPVIVNQPDYRAGFSRWKSSGAHSGGKTWVLGRFVDGSVLHFRIKVVKPRKRSSAAPKVKAGYDVIDWSK